MNLIKRLIDAFRSTPMSVHMYEIPEDTTDKRIRRIVELKLGSGFMTNKDINNMRSRILVKNNNIQ